MSEVSLLPRSLDDPAVTEAWIAGLRSVAIDRQLASHAALWTALLDDRLAASARWAGMLRFWPATAAALDRVTDLLLERPMPMTAFAWSLLESATGILDAMGQLALRCLVEEREALFLGLDAQSRRLRLKLLARVDTPDDEWLDLMRMARLAQARGVLDRHGPMMEPRLPSARAMVARPLLLRAADPFALPVPTLKLVDRVAGRLARRVVLRVEGAGEVPDNPLGATLAFGRAGLAMLDCRAVRDHLTRVVDDESRAADRRGETPADAGDPAREPRRAAPSAGWPALAQELAQCWTMPTLARDVALRRAAPAVDASQGPLRARLKAGPLVTRVALDIVPDLAVEPVPGMTVAGPATVGASMAGPATMAGMPTALAIEYVYGRSDRDGAGRTAIQAERRQRREQAVIERLMSESDLCFVVASDEQGMHLDRSAPTGLRLGGLLSVAIAEADRQRLVIGRLEACRHRPPPGAGLPPVQRLTLSTWPGEVRVVSLQATGDAWWIEAYYLAGLAGERPPAVVVGRGRFRTGETAVLRLVETDLKICFGEVLDQGHDYMRFAVSLVRG